MINLKKWFYFGLITLGSFTVYAQPNDSIQKLDQVVITSFKRNVAFLETTNSAAKISSKIMQTNHPERILEAVNAIPGAKLEERSPGSYRVSLRGSTIRSPFGVRNVKIYLDDFILTDASGNSYLNSLDPHLINNIDVLKGPQGGEIGNETGGAMLLNTSKSENISLDLTGGSYAMFGQKFNFSKQLGKHFLQIAQSYYDSDSYREQSAVNRQTFFIKDNWKYHKNKVLNATVLYSDLQYQTPGGLTLQQMQNNRKQARLATATLPSATEQNAGIYNKTFLGGLSHLWEINSNWSHFVLVQTSFTDFKNPFISNYEVRDEKNLQGRMFVQYQKQLNNISLETRLGLETGINQTDIKNYDNLRGTKGNAQKFDDLKTQAAFYYVTQNINLKNKFIVDASLSLNTMHYDWKTLYPFNETGKITFKNQWLPSLGVLYKLKSDFIVRAKIAKGTSAPTTEEVRSSNQNIATNLAAEYGWNTEFGIRKRLSWLFAEATVFDFKLKDAIVKRHDANGNEYFINAGGTKQLGAEFLLETDTFTFNHTVFNGFKFLISGNYYDFTYKDYQVSTNNFSGKNLPGISNWSAQAVATLHFYQRFTLNFSNYYQSKMYLNDANSVSEKGFVVGNIKLNNRFNFYKITANFYLGAQNIYNTKYSAGYDLNAFGNRFYNPTALANFYVGCNFKL